MSAVQFNGTFSGWKRAARAALVAERAPSDVQWVDGSSLQEEFLIEESGLLSTPPDESTRVRVPRSFLELASEVACHRDQDRWALLYRVLWRLTHGEAHLLEVTVDDDVSTLQGMAKAVRRDVHKMRAFVRFREVETTEGPWFVAWFEPQHYIVEANAPFFVDRFPNMRWSILTPERCAHWDTRELRFTAGVDRSAAPRDDAVEDLWRTYYASIFNPARVKVGAMTSEMPRHYWKNLPEAGIIPSLLAEASGRVQTMVAASDRKRPLPEEFGPAPVPNTRDVGRLRKAAESCRACPLWRNATCVVFGAGPSEARVMLVGEQPGDQEDRAGEPFVGPAGKLLDRALIAAGVDRSTLYLTNAVKHFKWEPRGKRRIHQKPNAREVAACRPWLEAEVRAIKPELIVCLGATAARSVVGADVRVLSERGKRRDTEFGIPALITVHPSSLLRMPEGSDAEVAFKEFVRDLRRIRD
jgi:DNA polymerase